MMGKYDERIAAGMALLDEKVPGWEWRVDVDRLKLSDCKNCVVGQLFRSEPALLGKTPIVDDGYGWDFFTEGVERLGVSEDDGAYGFSLVAEDQTWPGLSRAWKRQIRARLAPSTGSGQAAQATGSEGR